MKHTLLLLLAATLSFASYGQKHATKKKTPHTKRNWQPPPAPGPPTVAASFYWSLAAASKQIQMWHNVVKNNAVLQPAVNSGRTAFLIPKCTLDTLINNLKSDYVVVYIGMDANPGGTGMMSLYYTGVKYDAAKGQLNNVVMSDAAGLRSIFELAYPCPTCDNADLHKQSSLITQVPNANITSWVTDDNGGRHGEVEPEGLLELWTTDTTVQYTFTPDSGYKVGSITYDGNVINNPPNPYPVTNPTCTHELSVTFISNSGNTSNKVQRANQNKPKK